MYNFQVSAKIVNSFLYNEYKLSLNFNGLNDIYEDLRNIDSFDLKKLSQYSKYCLQWQQYLYGLYNILSLIEDEYAMQKETYIYIKELHKKDLLKKNKGKPLHLDFNIKSKYNIKSFNNDEITLEIEDFININRVKQAALKSFRVELLSKSKFFEKMYYETVFLHSKGIKSLHFGNVG